MMRRDQAAQRVARATSKRKRGRPRKGEQRPKKQPRRLPRRDATLKQDLKTEAQAQRAAGHLYPETLRYRERSTVERVNGRLKDEFGARHVRVRGHSKVLCHLMFGVLALTVDQILRLLN